MLKRAKAAQDCGALGVLYTGKPDATEKIRAPLAGDDGSVHIPVLLLDPTTREELLKLLNNGTTVVASIVSGLCLLFIANFGKILQKVTATLRCFMWPKRLSQGLPWFY